MNVDYNKLADKYDVSPMVVQHLANAIALGNGQLAQFQHPELGGMGQWMPGMIMIGDAFNYMLKAKVDALCHELAQAYKSGQFEAPSSQTSYPDRKWWSADLQNPSLTGGQNTLRYAYFIEKHRLIVMRDGNQTIYDTTPHILTGVSQQQSNNRTMLVFHTKGGHTLSIDAFKTVTS